MCLARRTRQDTQVYLPVELQGGHRCISQENLTRYTGVSCQENLGGHRCISLSGEPDREDTGVSLSGEPDEIHLCPPCLVLLVRYSVLPGFS